MAALNEVHRQTKGLVLKHFKEINCMIIEVEQDDTFLSTYRAVEGVLTVEEDVKCHRAFNSPNDPLYSNRFGENGAQWGLERIEPEKAWEMLTPRHDKVLLAIIDSAIEVSHPDLRENIYETINLAKEEQSDYDHGTAVTGVAAAVTDNKKGIASVSYNQAHVLSIAVDSSVSRVIEGVLEAVRRRAKIISISLWSPEYVHALQQAINHAWSRGLIIVAGAGNYGSEYVGYPAGNNYVLSVSATNQEDEIAYFSNWGIHVGVCAPGEQILTTVPTYKTNQSIFQSTFYDYVNGTSFSTPFVSGAIVLLWSLFPKLTNQELVQLVQRGSSPLDLMGKKWSWNPYAGYGLINVRKTVEHLLEPARSSSHEKGSFYGQLIDQNGLPVEEATITASIEGVDKALYRTKPIRMNNSTYQSDGMFRLSNLPSGFYEIQVGLEPDISVVVERATVVPGGDVYLQLVVDIVDIPKEEPLTEDEDISRS